jgi:hypothetical protein
MRAPADALPSRRQVPGRRTWGAAALAVLVLLSGIEIHQAAGSHAPGAALARHSDVYFLGASHPLLPPHAESATAARRPFCALCLNPLDGVGARFGQTDRISISRTGHPLPAAPSGPALRRTSRPEGARAPPLA